MSDAAKLISQIEADGIVLSPTERGTIKAKGNRAKLAQWVPILRERKPEILRELSVIASIFEVTVDGVTFIAISPGSVPLANFERTQRDKFGKRLDCIGLRSRLYRRGLT